MFYCHDDPWRNISQLSHEEILRIQNNKLYSFINQQLYPFSPYYRNLFDYHKINPRKIKSMHDLRCVPFISKSDFIPSPTQPEKFKDFILQPDQETIRKYWPKDKVAQLALRSILKGPERMREALGQEYRPVFMTFTTGTTNTPVSFLYSSYDVNNLGLYGSRMIRLFKIQPTDRIVNIFPFAPHLAFWQVVFGGLSSSIFILSTGGGKVLSSEGNINAILKMKPSVILGVPSYIYHLLRLAQEKSCKMDFIKKVILGAAAVTEPFKQKLLSLLTAMGATDVSIFGTYGFTEARTAWAECPTTPGISSGYHLYPDKEIIEIIDPKTGEVKREGEDGEIVYTSLDSRASSVIRFRTGDFVKGGVTYQPCPYCGRKVPRLSSQISRISDITGLQLSKIKGSLVNLDNFSAVLSEFEPIQEWQIEIRKKDNDAHEIDELIVFVAVKDHTDKCRLAEDLKKRILLCTEVSPNAIVFSSLPEIVKRLELETASKEKRILDSRPKA